MIRINLLPYRAERRQRQILEHLIFAIGAVALATAICLSAHWIASSQLSSLEDEYAQVRAENTALQKKIGKIKDLDALRADVERKLKLVDELQRGRFKSLLTLDEIANRIPENVWLSSIKDNGATIDLDGLGESNTAVANFMRNLESSDIFSNVQLKVISRKSVSGSVVREFHLTCNRVDKAEEPTKAENRKGKAL